MVQVKQLDGYGLGPLAIGRFDRAEMFAPMAHDDDAPASELSGGGPLSGDLSGRHGGKIIGAEREGESAGPLLPQCYPRPISAPRNAYSHRHKSVI